MLVRYTEVLTDGSTRPYCDHEMPDGCHPRKGEVIDDGMSQYGVIEVVWVMAPVRHSSDPDLIVVMSRIGVTKLTEVRQ